MVLENVMELGGVRLLPDRGIAYAGGEELALTPKEFALFKVSFGESGADNKPGEDSHIRMGI